MAAGGLNALDVMKAVFGMEVDQSPLERGLKDAESKVEQSSEKIGKQFNAMGVSIATGISIAVVAALTKATRATAEWGQEVENLSARMGMTARETSTFLGVMEQFGIHAQVGAITMARLSMSVKQTQEALDPFNTKMGRLFGSLREANGEAMNLGQVFDLARQKVAGAGTEMEKLQIAMAVAGPRSGGKMLEILKLNNEEWDKFKKNVEDSGTVVNTKFAEMGQRYENVSAQFDQSIKGLEVKFGEQLLPTVITVIDKASEVVRWFTKLGDASPGLLKIVAAFLAIGAPITAVTAGLFMLNRGFESVSKIMEMVGLQSKFLNTVLGETSRAEKELTTDEERAAIATKSHSTAVKEETAALVENAAAQKVVQMGLRDRTTGKYTTAAAMGKKLQEDSMTTSMMGTGTLGGGAAAGAGGQGMMGKMLGGMMTPQGMALTMLAPMALAAIPTIYQAVRQKYFGDYEGKEQEASAMAKARGEGRDLKSEGARSREEDPKLAIERLKVAQETAKEMKEAASLGIVSAREAQKAAEAELVAIRARTERIQAELAGKYGGLSEEERQKKESELLQLKIQTTKQVEQIALEGYKQEELRLKAQGAFAIENEMALMQAKLNDERIVGDERLKLEGDLFEKRKRYTEQVFEIGKKMGIVSQGQDIAFHQQRAGEALGKGNVTDAAQELLKARDLALAQVDQTMQAMKLMRQVSVQEEIDAQRVKLDMVKGNADEEMKILSSIADLDKNLYSERKTYAESYFGSVRSGYENSQAYAGKGGGEQFRLSDLQRGGRESEFELSEQTRTYGDVLHGGGSTAQIGDSVKFAQEQQKAEEQRNKANLTATDAEAHALEIANEILQRYTGQEQRAAGQPSPVVGSILSSTEGLATTNLAKGSEIPRLDTSFTDLSVRIRDVLLGVIPNVQSFSDALALATKTVVGQTGLQVNFPPGAEQRQFQTPLATGLNTPVQPQAQTGQGGQAAPASGNDAILSRIASRLDSLSGDIAEKVGDHVKDSNESVKTALDQFKSAGGSAGGEIKVSVDESGHLFAEFVKKTVANELKPF